MQTNSRTQGARKREREKNICRLIFFPVDSHSLMLSLVFLLWLKSASRRIREKERQAQCLIPVSETDRQIDKTDISLLFLQDALGVAKTLSWFDWLKDYTHSQILLDRCRYCYYYV